MEVSFGVKRAVDTVYEQLKNGKTIYTYGPIVHNEEVVRELAEKGVRVLESKEELKSLKAGENIYFLEMKHIGILGLDRDVAVRFVSLIGDKVYMPFFFHLFTDVFGCIHPLHHVVKLLGRKYFFVSGGKYLVCQFVNQFAII